MATIAQEYIQEGIQLGIKQGLEQGMEQGSFIFLPPRIQHGYTIRSDDAVRLLVITAPIREGLSGGWGGFVSDMELGQGELIAKPPHVVA